VRARQGAWSEELLGQRARAAVAAGAQCWMHRIRVQPPAHPSRNITVGRIGCRLQPAACAPHATCPLLYLLAIGAPCSYFQKPPSPAVHLHARLVQEQAAHVRVDEPALAAPHLSAALRHRWQTPLTGWSLSACRARPTFSRSGGWLLALGLESSAAPGLAVGW
jgi:hypothetical protein